jgi:excisionase family DNA binding protein
VDNDRTGKPPTTPRRVPVDEAARLLGISDGAVRQRIKRGTIEHVRDGGRLYVLLYDDPTADTDRPHDRTIDRTSELIATLREQLQQERQAHAEARRIIAGLVERIPALEAPSDTDSPPRAREQGANAADDETATQTPDDDTAQRRVPWWRRWLGS